MRAEGGKDGRGRMRITSVVVRCVAAASAVENGTPLEEGSERG